MSTFATATLSVAVQVIACALPATQDSPPFGEDTAATGAWLSIGTVPAVPGFASNATLLQSRSWTAVTVSEPLPPAAALVTATLNRLPVNAVGPHAPPTEVPSTVYEPPPLSVT